MQVEAASQCLLALGARAVDIGGMLAECPPLLACPTDLMLDMVRDWECVECMHAACAHPSASLQVVRQNSGVRSLQRLPESRAGSRHVFCRTRHPADTPSFPCAQGRQMQEQLGLTQTAFLALLTAAPRVLCMRDAAQQLGAVALFLRRALHCNGPLFSSVAARCPAVFAMQVLVPAAGCVLSMSACSATETVHGVYPP